VLAEFRRRWVLLLLVAVFVLIADQISKAAILSLLGPEEHSSIPLVGNWLRFTFIKNTGIAFGLFQGIPHFFTITSLLISFGALYFYRFHLPEGSRLIQVSVGLIFGGAIGNIIDRIRYSYVVDFVHVTWFPGIFNLADSAISIGVVMFSGYLLLYGDKPQKPTPPPDDALLNDLLAQDTGRRADSDIAG